MSALPASSKHAIEAGSGEASAIEEESENANSNKKSSGRSVNVEDIEGAGDLGSTFKT